MPTQKPVIKVALIGATGLVGKACLSALLNDSACAHVAAIVRRRSLAPHEKVTEIVANFDRLDEVAEAFGADALICALGTTLKVAGSKEAFRHVDFDYALKAAQLACARGASRLALVSSVGANAHSKFFYPRVKGELEEALRTLPFQGVDVFRPSFLRGHRPSNQKPRLAEKLALRALATLDPVFLARPLRKYRPVDARKLAQDIVESLHREPQGFVVHEACW